MTWRRPLKPRAGAALEVDSSPRHVGHENRRQQLQQLAQQTWQFARNGTLAIETSKPVATLSLDSWVGRSWKQSRNFPIAPPKMRNHLESCAINLNHFNFENEPATPLEVQIGFEVPWVFVRPPRVAQLYHGFSGHTPIDISAHRHVILCLHGIGSWYFKRISP